MSIGDPIADMITRIRNATRNKAKAVDCLNSKVCRGIADVLKAEGFIESFDVIADGRQGLIKIRLRYGPGGEPLFHRMQRLSKPGRRVYTGVDGLPKPLGGLGIAIVSTSHGVFSDRKAREQRVGGELLCVVE
jgi:small subunit ribosomal protein S8